MSESSYRLDTRSCDNAADYLFYVITHDSGRAFFFRQNESRLELGR
jgi:hypothetical protein